MAVGTAALASYAEQAAITEAAVRAAAEIWGELDPSALTASWVQAQIGTRLFLTTARAQELAAFAADVAVGLVLLEQGIEVDPDSDLIPSSLAGVASDGRDLNSLLLQPLITTNVAQAGGATAAEALSMGLSSLVRIVGTQVLDSGRAATGMGVATRRGVGYVRLVNPGACSRCVVLAGRFYRWSSGFQRHPLCGCRNIPAAEDTETLTAESDPMTHFRSLTESEQDKAFTKSGAQAIRDGADISQVVNSRRGALGLDIPGRLTAAERQAGLRKGDKYRQIVRTDVYGRPIYITREGTTKRGVAGKYLIQDSGSFQQVSGLATRITRNGPELREIHTTRARAPRLMPEAIYELAKDRADAIRLLDKYGYTKTRLNADVERANAAARRAREAYEASRAARGL